MYGWAVIGVGFVFFIHPNPYNQKFDVSYIMYPTNHRKEPYGSVFTNEYQILVRQKVAFLFGFNNVIWIKNFFFSLSIED